MDLGLELVVHQAPGPDLSALASPDFLPWTGPLGWLDAGFVASCGGSQGSLEGSCCVRRGSDLGRSSGHPERNVSKC